MKKMYFLFSLCLAFLLLGPSTLSAQEITLDKVMRYQLRSSGTILSGNQIDGYYFFYQVDRVDRKTRAFLLKIFDANLKEVSSKIIEESKYFVLLEGSFNGVTLMLEFYDYKLEEFVLRQYDRDAELISENKAKTDPKWSAVLAAGNSGELQADFLFPIPYQGFVNLRPKKHKKMGYEIQFISIDRTSSGWTYSSPTNSNLFEVVNFLDGNSEYAAFMVAKKTSLLTNKVDFFLQTIDLETGEEIALTPLQNKDHAVYPLKGKVDPETGNIMILGQYYRPGDKPFKHKSQGLFSFTYDKQGNMVEESLVSWVKDVGKFVPIDDKGKIEDVGFIYFHYMTRTADGKIYAIGEQYRKAVSAGGVALKALAAAGGGTADISSWKIVTEDLMVFKFSEDFELEDLQIFDKSKSNVSLPGGYGTIGVVKLGHILKSYGWFDYSFTQMSEQEDGFMVGYVDYEKIKGAKNRTVFGGLVLHDGEFTVDKIPVVNKGNRLIIMPAKPGFVLVAEYDKRARAINMRLEKINY